MKYIVVLGDGMADYKIESLNNLTPLDVAKKPNIDSLAKRGQIGLVNTIPIGLKPGSDVANLSVMGYPPEQYYSGRSPLEALSMGITLDDTDVAIRCNLVTLSDEKDFSKKTMLDYSAGEISSAEAAELITAVNQLLQNDKYSFFSGVSYRHCLVAHNGTVATDLTPPHDISDRKITEYLPKGKDSEELLNLMIRSNEVLANHPVNLARVARGIAPATNVWLWGAGTRPQLDDFYIKYGLRGAVISAVDLLRGIAVGAKMRNYIVEGATGNIDTNFDGKVDALFEAFKDGCDYVYLHIEAADECGHRGELDNKIFAIEKIDYVVGKIINKLDKDGEEYVIAVLPDHATPICLKTHTSDAIPYLIYKSNAPANCGLVYNETSAIDGIKLNAGKDVLLSMLSK